MLVGLVTGRDVAGYIAGIEMGTKLNDRVRIVVFNKE